MPRPRIFVSHSNDDPHSPAYLVAIEQELTLAGFDVLIDRTRLQPGAGWRNEIYTWMGLCHGAVILVSDAAMQPDSVWVPRETSILLWRRTLDPGFLLVPACLGSVTPENLRGGVFADMQLNEVQTAPSATPDQLVAALLDRFRPLAGQKTPLETLASRIADLLRAVSDRAIEEAAEQMTMDSGPWSPRDDPRHALALALLDVPLRNSIAALEILAEYLDSSKADQILAMVAPSWVDICAARWLADCGTCVLDRPAVILNASTHFSAAMYVHRASCRPPKTRWPVIPATGIHGERVAEEVAAEVEQNLIQEFGLDDDPLETNVRQRLKILLHEREQQRRPVFVDLRFSPALAAALPELQRLLPGVTFILLSGDEFPARPLIERMRVRLVEPRLGSGAEVRAQGDFDYARSIIRPRLTGV